MSAINDMVVAIMNTQKLWRDTHKPHIQKKTWKWGRLVVKKINSGKKRVKREGVGYCMICNIMYTCINCQNKTSRIFKRMKLDLYPLPLKFISKWIKHLNIIPDILKLLKKTGKALQDTSTWRTFWKWYQKLKKWF